jgi:hypothetical protein
MFHKTEPGRVGSVVASPTEKEGRQVRLQNSLNTSAETFARQVEAAEGVEGQAVGTALNHDGGRLEAEDDLVVETEKREGELVYIFILS